MLCSQCRKCFRFESGLGFESYRLGKLYCFTTNLEITKGVNKCGRFVAKDEVHPAILEARMPSPVQDIPIRC